LERLAPAVPWNVLGKLVLEHREERFCEILNKGSQHRLVGRPSGWTAGLPAFGLVPGGGFVVRPRAGQQALRSLIWVTASWLREFKRSGMALLGLF